MPVPTVSPDTPITATLERHVTASLPDPAEPDRGLLEVLAGVPDPRDRQGLRYPMALLLTIAILATAAGMRGFAGYATWARTAPPHLLAELGLSKSYRPSDKTFRRVFALIDPAELDRRLGGYFAALAVTAAPEGELIAVAIDGKTLRLAKRMGAAAAHLVSAFTHHTHLVIGQLSVDDKTNEIPTVRTLLKTLRAALRAAGTTTKLMITIDAMHTQTATARLIGKTLGWHYLMIVKDNQAATLARLAALPWHLTPVAATDSDDKPRHGRIETRTIQILTAANEIDFPHARQAIRIVRDRTIVSTGKHSREVVYAICTAPFEQAKPHQITTWLRQHWGIENRLHYVRDWTYDEDRCSTRSSGTHHILATIRNTALNLHRLHGADNIAEACRATAFTISDSLRLLQNPTSNKN